MIRPLLLAVAAGALVAGCAASPVDPVGATVPSPVAVAPVPPLPTAAPPITVADPPTTTARTTTSTRAPRTTTTTPAEVIADRCTNQRDYSNDPRDNATINSIGEETGSCPEPRNPVGEVDDGVEDDSDIDIGPPYSSSGEAQYDWGCQQGYITEGC